MDLLAAIGELQWNASLSTSDTAMLERTLAPEVALTRPDGTLIVGAHRVAREVISHWDAEGAYLTTMLASQTLRCVSGAAQTGAYTVQRLLSPLASVEVESGSYGIRWREANGALVADRVTFDTKHSEASMEGAVGCAGPGRARFARSFIELGAMPIALGTRWDALNALEHDLNRSGWTRTAAALTAQVPGPTLTSFITDQHGRSTSPDDGIAMVTVRLGSSIGLQGTTQLGAGSGALLTYNEARQSRLYQEFIAREQSIAGLFIWRGLRVGGGPALVHVNWREKYQQVYVDPKKGYQPAPGIIADSTWARRIPAGILQAAYAYPFGRWAFCQAIARYRFDARVVLPGVETHESWSASMNGYSAGVGLGVAW